MSTLELEQLHAGNRFYERKCRGKRPYITLQEADWHARDMHRKFKKHFDAYHCEFCGMKHVGSRRKNHHVDGDNSVAASAVRSRLVAPTASLRTPLGEGY